MTPQSPQRPNVRPPFGARLRLPTLPRETRDTLFLLGVIGAIVGMQTGHIPVWTSALAAAVLVWRGWIAWRGRPLPGWPWRLALTVAAAGLTVGSHRTLLGPEAGVTLIVVLLTLKTLEMRTRRDAYVIFFLGFFTLWTPLLRSQSLLTALGIGLAVWGLLTALVLAHLPNGRPPLWQAARAAGGMALAGAPIMALLFALFPRLPPLWGIPTDSTIGRSGLSGQMQVGDVAQLALDERVALRVAFPDGAPPREALYFRGPVLRVFDGRRWRPLHGPDAAGGMPPMLLQQDTAGRFQPTGPGLRYQVTMEPSLRPWLLTLEATPTAPVITAAGAGVGGCRPRRPRTGSGGCRARSPTCCATRPWPTPRTAAAPTPRARRCMWIGNCRRATTPGRWHGPTRCGASWASPPPQSWSKPSCATCARAATATRWSRASMAATPRTNSGSTGGRVFVNTLPRPSSSPCARWTSRRGW
ncbi:hypothetical protein A9O67_10180 [Tepidimonas fonticaldi]|uniref:Protein-glutamine gamma-glutamyltransferase TgpA N-terminal domain-containing protein n=1 Tax=Tepidimonas fonticaldi TaxID=1101373 RepID=A0A1A6DSV0_9BURK|nr:hypothetical protein A9O67_10180 [Tepidimonas fonticaldi]